MKMIPVNDDKAARKRRFWNTVKEIALRLFEIVITAKINKKK